MRKLQIFSTARAIRKKINEYKKKNEFLPKLMRIDEFEKSIAIVPNSSIINPTQRVFLLKEAANFEEFKKLKSQRDLLKFFLQSEDFFKFFEELSWEMVDLKELLIADSYAEFEEHIEVLYKLRENYKKLLEKENFSDKMFIPQNYKLNLGFIENFESFEIFLDGYLSKFELKLLQEVSQIKEFIVHIRTNKYNKKMIERFSEIGITLPMDSEVTFNLSTKKIITSKKIFSKTDAKVYSLQSRFEQVAVIFGEVERMVQSGILPEEIAVIVPDESFAQIISLYDRLKNYNLAMGFEYTKTLEFRKLKAISNYYKNFENFEQLNFFGISLESLNFSINKNITLEEFFEKISEFKIKNLPTNITQALEFLAKNQNVNVATTFLNFFRLFNHLKLSFKEWLYLWLKELENIRIDDVGGGKVTIMGVLETRGIDFKGVIICDFNEGVVPTISTKDRFLNSNVRKAAKLPTKEDRDSLQRYYYKSLIERAQNVVILYHTSEEMIPSKFLYELNLPKAKSIKAPLNFLYKKSTLNLEIIDQEIDFDPKKEIWSPTKLETWLSCKRKFYFKYILKIEEKPKKEINSGAILHASLRNIFRKRDHFNEKLEFKKALEKDLERFEKEVEFKYHKKVWIKSLENFFETQIEHFRLGWRVYECEFTISGELEGIRFSGKIDRIDKKEEKFLLIDYKSGSVKNINKKSLEDIKDFQLNIYHLLLKDKLNLEDQIYWELFSGKSFSLTNLEEKNERLSLILKELKKQKSFVNSKCEDLSFCRFCDYRLMCQRGEYV
jgi:inactivated superfamily I helicase/CRISPR/Cas system-associated exonuclease Cas4 (RecB family)